MSHTKNAYSKVCRRLTLLLDSAVQSRAFRGLGGRRVGWPDWRNLQYPVTDGTGFSWVFIVHHSVSAVFLVENGMAVFFIVLCRYSNSVMKVRLSEEQSTCPQASSLHEAPYHSSGLGALH